MAFSYFHCKSTNFLYVKYHLAFGCSKFIHAVRVIRQPNISSVFQPHSFGDCFRAELKHLGGIANAFRQLTWRKMPDTARARKIIA